MGFFRNNPKSWHKPDGTTVTEADLAVDEHLRSTITKARPQDGWLSEETPHDGSRLTRRRLWIADPIDGTRLFLAGENNWGIGVALVENGKAVLSALLRPSQGILLHAVAGGGTFRDGKPLPAVQAHSADVIAPKAFAGSLGEAGFRHLSGSHLPLLLRFAAIAEGELAGAITLGNKNDWDVAAGELILAEAGGHSSTAQGETIVYNRPQPWQPGVVSGQANWHGPLLDLVRHH